ncbi:MAG: translation elongation factor Ts [Candidatus Latescibacteria bacterium]|nr:translation elongation factor Ts [Candidatus Latescibacterota bacterium]
MDISAKDVMSLRRKTGAGMMDCKKALIDANGDIDKAVDILREKGVAAAQKRAGRDTSNGFISVYVHPGSRLAAMVELNCETDFVARNDDFQKFADDLAMHIAAANPASISEEDIDPETVAKEKEIYKAQALNEGKKPEFVDRIVDGRIKKFFKENCLLNQVYIKDESRKTTIQDLLNELIAKIGENIVIGRFARFQVGE